MQERIFEREGKISELIVSIERARAAFSVIRRELFDENITDENSELMLYSLKNNQTMGQIADDYLFQAKNLCDNLYDWEMEELENA